MKRKIDCTPRRPSCAGAWSVSTGLLAAILLLAGPALGDSRAITAESSAGLLSGTLERAEGSETAALILPGSGPTDRDGNNPLGVFAGSYRLLAEALAAEGISTARIDKRGIGESDGDPNAVSLATYAEDTSAWITTILEETDAPCVWLIGHSEGGLLALTAADHPEACGLVLLATPGRSLDHLILDQIAAQPGAAPYLPAMRTALDQLSEGVAPDTADLPPALAAVFLPEVQDYLGELVRTDPAALLAQTDLPTLVLHGDADFQVPPSEGEILAGGRPDLEAQILSGMTHVLKAAIPLGEAEDVQSYITASARTYTDPELPLHADLVPMIAAFLRTER